MTVSEWLDTVDIENRKLRAVVFITAKYPRVNLAGVQCDPKFSLDNETVEDCLTDYDCQFDSDENGRTTGHSIFNFIVDYEDNSVTRELTLGVHDPCEESIEEILARKEKENGSEA